MDRRRRLDVCMHGPSCANLGTRIWTPVGGADIGGDRSSGDRSSGDADERPGA
jgi:hypothetical protein